MIVVSGLMIKKAIVDKFISDYAHRFKSTHHAVRIIPNLGLPKIITDINNIELTKPPNLEEWR